MILAALILSSFQVPPGNGPDAQELVDLAAPGSVVYLPEGSGVKRLSITKPLTIVGQGTGPVFETMVVLGPLAGPVVLSRLNVHFVPTTSQPQPDSGGLLATYNHELRVYDCTFEGHVWALGGLTLIERSSIFANPASFGGAMGDGTMILMDTTISAPRGPHVLAQRLYESGNVVVEPAPRYQVGEHLEMPRDLVLSGNPRLGGHVHLEWFGFQPGLAVLWGQVGANPPTLPGLNFLDSSAVMLRVTNARKANIPILPHPALIGTELTFELSSLDGRHSRPQFTLIRP